MIGPGPDHPARTDLAWPAHHGRHRDRLAAIHRRGDLTQLGKRNPTHRFDKDIEDSTARQANRERVIVTDSVGLEHGNPGPADIQR